MHRNKISCVVLLHAMISNIQSKDWVILFQQNLFCVSHFYKIKLAKIEPF